jgi:hypothetical protein
MANEHEINANSVGNGWIDGNIDGFRFQAKVYATGSQFGINGGAVSKLAVWDHRNGNFSAGVILNYDRGCDEKPENKEQSELLQALLRFLEALNPIADKPQAEEGATSMKIEFNVTGAQRKAFVKALSEILGEPYTYMGAPTFSYAVGKFTVDRNGAIPFPHDESYETMLPIIEALRERGYECAVDGDADFFRQHLVEIAPERAEYFRAALAESKRQMADPNAVLHDADEVFAGIRERLNEREHNRLVVEMPLDGFTDKAIRNLKDIITSKNRLIKKALGADDLPVDVINDKLCFPWFMLTGTDGEADAYTRFVCALCEMARTQQRVTAKENDSGNDKFTMRLFLIRLGFVGPEFKEARKILLRNLTGSTAWKDGKRPVNSDTRKGVPDEE